MALILGIESTCDETGAAVVRDGREVLSNVVASQVELHAKYRGVVPEIASRAHIENILPVVREALGSKDEQDAPDQLESLPSALAPLPSPPIQHSAFSIQHSPDAIAIAHRPGLIGSLLIGVTAAKTLAWAWGKPLIG